jgi:hypothetical protein
MTSPQTALRIDHCVDTNIFGTRMTQIKRIDTDFLKIAKVDEDKNTFHKDSSSFYSSTHDNKIRFNPNHPCHPCSISRIKKCIHTVTQMERDLKRFVV